MPSITKTMFASAADVEAAFYDALALGDIEAMMAVWAEDEEIVCVHPGGTRLFGYMAIRESWVRIFSSQRLKVHHTLQGHHNEQLSAVHYVLEEISVDGEAAAAPVMATNVYIRSALGWRMLLHHASAAPPDALAGNLQVLH